MTPLLNVKSYNVTRTTAPNPVSGRAVAGVQTVVPIKANIHHVSDRDMMTVPEERRGEDIRFCFTSSALYIEGKDVAGTKYKADRINVDGEVFEVFKVSGPWSNGHYRAYIAKRSTP